MIQEGQNIEAQWRPLRGQAVIAAPAPVVVPASATDNAFAEQWPALAAAMKRYEQNVAADFMQSAYAQVSGGLIRGGARQRLARQAASSGIRAFDAQLLIACAIRQWQTDQQAMPAPARQLTGTTISWKKWTFAVAVAIAADVLLICYWMGR